MNGAYATLLTFALLRQVEASIVSKAKLSIESRRVFFPYYDVNLVSCIECIYDALPGQE